VDAEAEAEGTARSVDTAGTDGRDVPLARFPRGAGPGSFLHDVLEHLDLTAMDDDAALDDVLQAMERRHGIDPSLRPMVVDGLRAAVATPMGEVADGARLANLGKGDRLNELWFDLPLAGGHAAGRPAFSLDAVADLLADSGDPLLEDYATKLREPGLRGRVRGYLVGSIDLLARLPDGRFLVADYKSNWLGDRASGRSTVGHYHPTMLAEELQHHHYVLQALLYLVATHRYLRWRLPGYDYDTHVAGAAYLFLRGMVGPDTPEVDGQRHGVAVVRPAGDLVEALSRLLDGSGP
jgi:exodeoxyribonuclease V beta subunit